MLLQIHDELIFEAQDDQIEHVGKQVKHQMENVMQLKIPLDVKVSIGKNWGVC